MLIWGMSECDPHTRDVLCRPQENLRNHRIVPKAIILSVFFMRGCLSPFSFPLFPLIRFFLSPFPFLSPVLPSFLPPPSPSPFIPLPFSSFPFPFLPSPSHLAPSLPTPFTTRPSLRKRLCVDSVISSKTCYITVLRTFLVCCKTIKIFTQILNRPDPCTN